MPPVGFGLKVRLVQTVSLTMASIRVVWKALTYDDQLDADIILLKRGFVTEETQSSLMKE